MINILSKFPVTSEKGNIYRVDVESLGFPHETNYYVSLFQEERTRWGKVRFKLVAGGPYEYGNIYSIHDWGFDFVKIAKHKIKNYEDGLELSRKFNSKLTDANVRFEKWDGNIEQ